MHHYNDYCWKKGFPEGIGKNGNNEITYRIISDPYWKWASIEQYKLGTFDKVIYDSHLLDFRHLNPANQATWQKITLGQTDSETRCLIRNQDDRALVYETHIFKGQHCIECRIHSIHHILVAVQKMSYSALGDPFDGVTLYDSNFHPVMYKLYKTDPDTGEFTELIKENWEINIEKEVTPLRP
jgi:hypothetical protein